MVTAPEYVIVLLMHLHLISLNLIERLSMHVNNNYMNITHGNDNQLQAGGLSLL
jgi:hypothetical protein